MTLVELSVLGRLLGRLLELVRMGRLLVLGLVFGQVLLGQQ
jgi:hypothetical protein